jgi:hypothetical protein
MGLRRPPLQRLRLQLQLLPHLQLWLLLVAMNGYLPLLLLLRRRRLNAGPLPSNRLALPWQLACPVAHSAALSHSNRAIRAILEYGAAWARHSRHRHACTLNIN